MCNNNPTDGGGDREIDAQSASARRCRVFSGVVPAGGGTVPLPLAPDNAVGWRSHLPALAWLALFVVAVLALGLSPGLPLALLAFHLAAHRSGLLRALLAGATMLVIVEGVFAGILGVSIYRGLIGG